MLSGNNICVPYKKSPSARRSDTHEKNASMERCSSTQAAQGPKGWAAQVTSLDVTGAGYLWGGNVLSPGIEKMESSSGGVLRAEVILLIKSRSDLQSSWCSPAGQQCCPWKEESGQSGTGSVTKKARLKKSYCHQRQRQMIREEKKGEKDAKSHEHFLLLSWSPEDPNVAGWARQGEAVSRPVCQPSENCSGKVTSQNMAEPCSLTSE